MPAVRRGSSRRLQRSVLLKDMSDGRMCPFYKTKERANAEIIECIDRKAEKYAAEAKRAKK